MDKKRFLELVELYKGDPKALDSLSKEEREAFQQQLTDRGFELPEFGVDGRIGSETRAAFDEYIKSDVYADELEPAQEITDEGLGSQNQENPEQIVPNETPLQRKLRLQAEREGNYAQEKGAADRFTRDKALAQRDTYNAVQAGTDVSRLASAISQINQGKRQREDAVRPSMPMREVSPELSGAYQRALADTGRGFTDAERAAMSEQDMAGYSNALNSVGAIGQGQASIAGVGAQQLHNNKMKQNLQRVVADAQARQANNAYAASAGAALARDKDNLYRTQLQYGYMPALQEYRRKMGEAGITERQGRVNLDNLMSVAPYRAANMVGDYYGGGVSRGTETPLQREGRISDRQDRRRQFFNNLSRKFKKDPFKMNQDMDMQQGPIYDLPDYNPPLDMMNDPSYNPEYQV